MRAEERDTGKRASLTTSEREGRRALEREVRELQRANQILRKASAYFAAAGLDRLNQTNTTDTGRVPRTRPSARHTTSATEALRPEIQRIRNENQAVYWVRKVWRQLARVNVLAVRCTVDRLITNLPFGFGYLRESTPQRRRMPREG